MSDLVQICCLDIMLSVAGDDRGLDLLLPELPEKLLSCLVEDEAAADLNLLLGPQVHLLEKVESHLCRFLKIQFLPKIWCLEVVDWNDIVVKLPRLFSVSTDDGSEKKVADASIIHLNCHSFDTVPC